VSTSTKEAAVDQAARRALEYCRNFVANEWRIARDLALPDAQRPKRLPTTTAGGFVYPTSAGKRWPI